METNDLTPLRTCAPLAARQNPVEPRRPRRRRDADLKGRPRCPTPRSAAPSGSACATPCRSCIIIVPFGMLFGVVAAEAGWALPETMAMSFAVVAGASQFTAVQLFSDHAPALVVIATSLAVNLRLAMYSASLAPHLGGAPAWQRALAAYGLTDQTYGVVMNRYALQPEMSGRQKMAHYLGALLPVCVPWYAATWAGVVAGSAIPAGLALDFAVPVTFLALVGPALAQPALRRRRLRLGGGVPGALLDALQSLADRRGAPRHGDRRPGRGLAGAAPRGGTVSETALKWLVIVALGVGTYAIRYSFIGLVGDRALPPWASRLLRYVPVAVMPGLVAPLVVWPPATGGEPDPARLMAAVAALAIGAASRSVLAAIFGGMAVLYAALALIG